MEILLYLSTWISLRDTTLEGLSSGGSIIGDDLDTIFVACFVDEDFSRVLSSICYHFYFI